MKCAARNKGNLRDGFSLVELVAVIGIMGVLLNLGIMAKDKFDLRAKQAEARTNVLLIYRHYTLV